MNVPTRNSISARSFKMLSAALVVLAMPAFPQSPNQILSAGYRPPFYQSVAVGLITLFVPAIDVPDGSSAQNPPPTSLSGVSVAVRVAPPAQPMNNYYPAALGILRVYTEKSCFLFSPCPNTQITVLVPTNRVCIMGASSTGCRGGLEGAPPQIILNVKANGATGPDYSIQVNDSLPHLLNSCDSIFGPPSGSCYPLITHGDGTLVNSGNRAKVGEVITAWANGLGQGSTKVRFQYFLASDDPNILATYSTFIIPEWSGPTPGYLDLYQINFRIPSMPANTFQCAGTTQNNATIDISGNFTQAVGLCVLP